MLSRIYRQIRADRRYLPARAAQALWQGWSRARTRAVPQPDGHILCRVLGRYPLLVSTADVGLAPYLIQSGAWELWITRFIRRRLRPGMVCLDAGANLGYFTVVMADAVGSGGRVVAVEPTPVSFDLLQRNVYLNGLSGRVRPIRAALGATTGDEVDLVIPLGEPKNAIVQPPGADYGLGRPYQSVTALTLRVDDIDLARLDFVKIDVEGQEAQLWAGMQGAIARSPDIQIVMEVNGGRGAEVGDLLVDIQRQFALRAIDTVGNLHRVTVARVMSAPDDVMLYLARGG